MGPFVSLRKSTAPIPGRVLQSYVGASAVGSGAPISGMRPCPTAVLHVVSRFKKLEAPRSTQGSSRRSLVRVATHTGIHVQFERIDLRIAVKGRVDDQRRVLMGWDDRTVGDAVAPRIIAVEYQR